ncbi:major centromere autoantigen B-like, partial [Homalodisca vitripennis]|uniref:major centromere autoantigen B-like n=1 Tax=Homalodisca vitripennis TaxID=197043 RepID=UPI001EEB973D
MEDSDSEEEDETFTADAESDQIADWLNDQLSDCGSEIDYSPGVEDLDYTQLDCIEDNLNDDQMLLVREMRMGSSDEAAEGAEEKEGEDDEESSVDDEEEDDDDDVEYPGMDVKEE